MQHNFHSITEISLSSPSLSLPIPALTAKAAVTWSGFLFISLSSPLNLCVCVCVHVCVWREREREREREIGVEALWKVWDYFLQDFNWDIKTPFGCEKWRGKCVLKVLGQKIIALYCSLISHSMAAALSPLRPLPPPSWYFPRPFKPWVILSGSIPYWSCDLEQVASPLCVSVGLSVK